MTRLYLIRHAQALNAEGMWVGLMDLPLSGAGRRQTERLVGALRPVSLQAVYSSPLVRAVDTARPVADAHGVEVTTIRDLREMTMGAWEGLTGEEVHERFGPVLQDWWNDPERARIPGAEALPGVRDRVMAAVSDIVSRHPDTSVAVVAHGIVNRVAILTLIGAPFTSIWRIKQDNACINVIEVEGGRAILHVLNETTHLK